MKGWFALMKPGLFICGMVVAAMMIGGCKSSPTGNGGNTLSAPTPASPTNGSSNQATSLALEWNASSGATSYGLEVATALSFASPVVIQAGVTGTSGTVTGLSSSTTYYWRVNAANISETSGWSAVWSFTTSSGTNTAVPGVPVLDSPANGATGQSVAPALSWSSGSGGAVASYGVEVSTSASFGNLIVNQPGFTTNSMTPSGLSNNATYYWRVNAANISGTSGWSAVWSFTTIPAGTTIMGMVHIPGGTFQMGSNNTALYATPVHSVTVSSFYMDTTDVTQASYQALMGVNPSYFDTGAMAPRKPVEDVNWYDAALYCNARSKHDGYDTVYSYSSKYSGSGYDTLAGVVVDYTKHGYRLPTEAEWEYACRAGSTADYYWGQSYPPLTTADTVQISAHVWCWYNNTPYGTKPVATKPANAFGLYDMSGNVWQWCNDWYGDYSLSAQTDPLGPSYGSYRVLRGGSWYDDFGYGYGLDLLCAAYRGSGCPSVRSGGGGFRCVRR